MRKLKVFTSSLLLVTTTSMYAFAPPFVFPQAPLHIPTPQWEQPKLSYYTMTYDQMMHQINEIESGDWENRSIEELEKVRDLIIFLAKKGILPDSKKSLKKDIEELLNGEDIFSFETSTDCEYLVALLNEDVEFILCKSWLKKQLKRIKKFAKKHKKEIIIGAAVVVGGAAVIAVVAGASTAMGAAAVGAAGAAAASKKTDEKPTVTQEAPILYAAFEEQISSFKESVVQNEFFQDANDQLSWEETGRALGSLFAHGSYQDLRQQIADLPSFTQEIQKIHSQYNFSIPTGSEVGHPEIDRKFSTSYSDLYSAQHADFSTLFHQVRGERALEYGYYQQAVQDFGKAIEINPTNPLLYLERGVAYFELREYDRSLEDYHQFTSQAEKNYPLHVIEFCVGFAKGVHKGVYESEEGMLLFFTDFVKHPIQTSIQVIDSMTKLVELVRADEWGVIGEALSPKIYQLVTQWDTLPFDERGELIGSALSNHGTDIIAPAALAKVASKSVRAAQELVTVSKNIQMARQTLVLETAAGIGNSAKIAEIVETGQRTAFFAEELGFTAQEAGQLKQAGVLEATVAQRYDHLSLSMQESITLFEKAGNKLKPHQGIYMLESQVRELIHSTGIPTFTRPKGIPENYRCKLSDKPGGIKYVHPTDEGTYIRIMPGKAHSKNPRQQRPYVNERINGNSLDKHGNIVSNKSEEAHIPLDEFVYRENGKVNYD